MPQDYWTHELQMDYNPLALLILTLIIKITLRKFKKKKIQRRWYKTICRSSIINYIAQIKKLSFYEH